MRDVINNAILIIAQIGRHGQTEHLLARALGDREITFPMPKLREGALQMQRFSIVDRADKREYWTHALVNPSLIQGVSTIPFKLLIHRFATRHDIANSSAKILQLRKYNGYLQWVSLHKSFF